MKVIYCGRNNKVPGLNVFAYQEKKNICRTIDRFFLGGFFVFLLRALINKPICVDSQVTNTVKFFCCVYAYLLMLACQVGTTHHLAWFRWKVGSGCAQTVITTESFHSKECLALKLKTLLPAMSLVGFCGFCFYWGGWGWMGWVGFGGGSVGVVFFPGIVLLFSMKNKV